MTGDSAPLPSNVFVGIDVACAKKKRLPVCISFLRGKQLVPLQLERELWNRLPRGLGNCEIASAMPFRESASLLATALRDIFLKQSWYPVCIAIDAPAAPPINPYRSSEAILSSMRLSSFLTPNKESWHKIRTQCVQHLESGGFASRLPYANKIWMLYGFEIFNALRSMNYKVIEVYPYAIVSQLVSGSRHKSSREGYLTQLNAIAAMTGWLPQELASNLQSTVSGTKDDRLDAFMSCWVASLPETERLAIGNADDCNDSIWVPKIGQVDLR